MYHFPAALIVGGVGVKTPLVQTSFAVSTSGNDNGPGTPAQPWRTLARLQRALEEQRLNETIDTTVTIGPGLYEEALTLSCVVPPERELVVTGSKTTVYTGTITAYTGLNQGTSTPSSIQDAALVAATHVNRRFRITSGAALTAIAWGLLNTAADTMRVSQFATSAGATNPANGDSYVIETLDTSVGLISVEGTGGGKIIVQDITLAGGPPGNICKGNSFGSQSSPLSTFELVGCDITGLTLWINTAGVHRSCYYRSIIAFITCSMSIATGAAKAAGIFVNFPSILFIPNPFCSQGGDGNPRFTISGRIEQDNSGHIGIFNDAAGDASILINPGGKLIANDANAILWDNAANAKTNGVRVRSGGGRYYLTIDTLNGAVNDTNLGNVPSTYAAIVAAPLGSIVTGNDAAYVLRA